MKLHFTPQGKPAPPRPRRPEVFTSFTISARDILTAFFKLLVAAVAQVAIDVGGPVLAPDVLENQTALEGVGRGSVR